MQKYKQIEVRDSESAPTQGRGEKCRTKFASEYEMSAYIDRELPAWKRHLLRRHIRSCPGCAAHIAQLQHTDKFLRQVEPVKASDDFLTGVMTQVSGINQNQRQHRAPLHRIMQFIEASLVWVKRNIQTYSPVKAGTRQARLIYTFSLTLGVFTMVGVTLYAPPGDKTYEQPVQSFTSEKLISFEVIPLEQPKRSLKTVD